MGPFEYTVVICSEFKDYKEETIKGITFAGSYTEAMEQIEDYYGNEIVEITRLFACEECSIYELEG